MQDKFGTDILLNIRSYGQDIKIFIDDEDTYLKLLEFRKGFDQWQFYYDLLRFARVIDEYLPFMEENKSIFVEYFKDPNATIQRLNTIANKIKYRDKNKFNYIVNYIIPLHPYCDYTIIGTSTINNLPYEIRIKEFQEYNSVLWEDRIPSIILKHKHIMPYIYGSLKPLDYLLNKWIRIDSDIKYTKNVLGNINLDKIRSSMVGSNVRSIPGLTLDPRSMRGLAYLLHDLDRMPYVTMSSFTPLPFDLAL